MAHGGARKGAGRKTGIGISNTIKKYCDEMIIKLLQDEKVKNKAYHQLSVFKEENKKHYLYILKSNGLYKIGYTSNVKKRIKSYKSHGSNEFVFVINYDKAFELEVLLHERFKEKLKYGSEWYSFSDLELINVISFITEKYLNSINE